MASRLLLGNHACAMHTIWQGAGDKIALHSPLQGAAFLVEPEVLVSRAAGRVAVKISDENEE